MSPPVYIKKVVFLPPQHWCCKYVNDFYECQYANKGCKFYAANRELSFWKINWLSGSESTHLLIRNRCYLWVWIWISSSCASTNNITFFLMKCMLLTAFTRTPLHNEGSIELDLWSWDPLLLPHRILQKSSYLSRGLKSHDDCAAEDPAWQ
jgi:hypothetical protein